MDNLIDRAKFNISQLRGSEDGQLPDDLYVTNMLKRSGKTVSDMDRQMIMKMLSEGMPKEMVIQNILQESGRTMSGMDRAMVGGLGSVANSKNNMPYRDREMINKMAGGGPLNSMVQQTQQIMNNLGMDVAQDTKIIKNAFGLSDPMMAANILQKTFKNKYPNLKEDDINNLINYGHEAFSREASKNFSNGGEASFPDLNNDGETTYADVLVGRGVKFAEGGEAIDSELAGMQMSEEDAMSEVASLDNPEMKMIEQLIAVVQQLMAQGVGEQEIKMFLKEQGLDDEDINTLFEMLSESDMQQQGAGQIDQQLQGMM
jgi:hypothetical protein